METGIKCPIFEASLKRNVTNGEEKKVFLKKKMISGKKKICPKLGRDQGGTVGQFDNMQRPYFLKAQKSHAFWVFLQTFFIY